MSTVQTESSAPSSLDVSSQIDSYSSPVLIGFKQIKETKAFAISNPPTTDERRINHYQGRTFAKRNSCGCFTETIINWHHCSIWWVLPRSTQRGKQTDGGWVWAVVVMGEVEEAGFFNGKMLLDLGQGTKVGREATCRFEGKPDGEKLPPDYPIPKPKNTKTNSKGSSHSSSTASLR